MRVLQSREGKGTTVKCYAPRSDGQVLLLEHTKPFFVPDSISELHGPDSGQVVLPIFIDWTLASTFDMSNAVRVRSLYAKVLIESPDEETVATYVNGAVLLREWPKLRLPSYVRHAWEQRHPELRPC